MSFPFNFAKISKDRHFTVRRLKDSKLSAGNAIDSIFQENVLASLLLFSFVCYRVIVSYVKWTEIAEQVRRPVISTIGDRYLSSIQNDRY